MDNSMVSFVTYLPSQIGQSLELGHPFKKILSNNAVSREALCLSGGRRRWVLLGIMAVHCIRTCIRSLSSIMVINFSNQ